jgi:hypothetical protein
MREECDDRGGTNGLATEREGTVRRRTIGVLAAVSIITVPVLAQAPVDPGPAIEAVKQVAFLEGNWTGEGWIQMGQGPREEFTQVETVELKVDGSILQIEGIGHTKGENPEKVHHALALIAFDPVGSTLIFSSFVAGRPRLDVVPEVTENGFTWGFSPPNGGQIRYSLTVENDTWHEVGEYSPDGQSWFQFFEMRLTKQ